MLSAYPRHPRVSRRSAPGEYGECNLRGLDEGRLLSACALRLKKTRKLKELREREYHSRDEKRGREEKKGKKGEVLLTRKQENIRKEENGSKKGVKKRNSGYS